MKQSKKAKNQEETEHEVSTKNRGKEKGSVDGKACGCEGWPDSGEASGE